MSTDTNSTSGGWHADPASLSRYAAGSLDGSGAASVEAHLISCARCRAALTPAVDPARLASVWTGLLDRVDAPRRTPVERLLVRLGMREDTARLVAAAPSLTVSWLGALTAVLLFAALAADAGGKGVLLFLAVAPVLPVAGVAVAYGREVDPTYELHLAAPYSTLRLLLLRSGAVVVATMLLVGVAAILLPVDGWLAAAWLLPSLALTAATLAASTRIAPVRTAAAMVSAWIFAVFTAFHSTGSPYAAFGTSGQLLCGVLLTLSVAVLIHRGRIPAADLREDS